MDEDDIELFEQIYASYINGQKKQMARQIDELGDDEIADFLEFLFRDLDDPAVAVRIMISYFRVR